MEQALSGPLLKQKMNMHYFGHLLMHTKIRDLKIVRAMKKNK